MVWRVNVKKAKQPKQAEAQQDRPDPVSAVRPTPEQIARGGYVMADGSAGREAPMLHLHGDMIGRLGAQRRLSPEQVSAARRFQDIRAAYLAEIGVRPIGSCLSERSPGHDSGDGNKETITTHDNLRDRLGLTRWLFLVTETEKGSDRQPVDLPLLQKALDAVGC